MTPIPDHFDVDRARLEVVCEAFHVKWLAAFGSVVRGEQREESDIDVLYEFDPGTRASLFTLCDLSEALSPVFGGRFVDLGSPQQLPAEIRAAVMAEAVVLHAH